MANNPFVADFGTLQRGLQDLSAGIGRARRLEVQRQQFQQQMVMQQQRQDLLELQARRAEEQRQLENRQRQGAMAMQVRQAGERARAEGKEAKHVNAAMTMEAEFLGLPKELIPKYAPLDGSKVQWKIGDQTHEARDPYAIAQERRQAQSAMDAIMRGKDPVSQGYSAGYRQAGYDAGMRAIRAGTEQGYAPLAHPVSTDVPTRVAAQARRAGLDPARMFKWLQHQEDLKQQMRRTGIMAAAQRKALERRGTADLRKDLDSEMRAVKASLKALYPGVKVTESLKETLYGPEKTVRKTVPQQMAPEARAFHEETIKNGRQRILQLRQALGYTRASAGGGVSDTTPAGPQAKVDVQALAKGLAGKPGATRTALQRPSPALIKMATDAAGGDAEVGKQIIAAAAKLATPKQPTSAAAKREATVKREIAKAARARAAGGRGMTPQEVLDRARATGQLDHLSEFDRKNFGHEFGLE